MTIDIGTIISVLAVLISFLGYLLNKTKSIKSDGQQDAEFKAGLDYIRKGVDDIRIDIKMNEKQMADMSYVRSTLKDWHLKGFKTIQDVEASAEYRNFLCGCDGENTSAS